MGVPVLENLVAIPSLTPAPGAALPFDLFVRLPVSARVILYRREGSALDQEKFDKASERQLNFFVQRMDYDRYLSYVSAEFLRLLAQPHDRERAREIAGRVLSNAVTQDSAQEAKEIMRNLGDVVGRVVREMALNNADTGRQQLFLKFAHLAQTGTDFQRHPLNVASITVMIAIGIGLSDHKTLVEIALAALTHDVGLTQLPVSVINEAHRFKDLGTVSKALLKLHPQGALDLLWNRGIKVSKLMEQMILQHHEEYSGLGYPNAVSGEDLHPFAQILRVADDLDDVIGKTASGRLEHRIHALFRTYEVDQIISPKLCAQLRELISPKK